MKKVYLSLVLMLTLVGSGLNSDSALAKHHHKHKHCNHSDHRNWSQRNEPLFDYKTGKILKGGLIGAGIGAGTGILLNKPVGKTALIGGGIGSGVQAIRYSDTMNRHPIVKTAAYGALAGAGASQLSRREGSLTKGALWGAAIGTGVGAIKNSDF
jgi:hypothetical protein